MTTNAFENIAKIINKKNALKDLTDAEFEVLLP